MTDNAGAVLEKRMRKTGKSWEPDRFTLANGVDCWTAKQACYARAGSDEVDHQTTHALLGIC